MPLPHLTVEVPGAAGGERVRKVRRQLQDAIVHRHAAHPAAVTALLAIVQAQKACRRHVGDVSRRACTGTTEELSVTSHDKFSQAQQPH